MPAPAPGQRRELPDYVQVFEAVKGRPLAVDGLVVHGIGRTRPDLVVRELAGLSTARTLDEVRDVVEQAHDALQELGPYEAVQVILDHSRTVRT